MHNFILFLLLFSSSYLLSQDEVFLYNPSFEDAPRLSQVPTGWYDCNTPGNSPVETPPVPYSEFNVTANPAHGNTYVGMVVRENNAVEAIGQRLVEPLKKGRTYVFEIFLMRSPKYLSGISSSSKNNGSISSLFFDQKKIIIIFYLKLFIRMRWFLPTMETYF